MTRLAGLTLAWVAVFGAGTVAVGFTDSTRIDATFRGIQNTQAVVGNVTADQALSQSPIEETTAVNGSTSAKNTEVEVGSVTQSNSAEPQSATLGLTGSDQQSPPDLLSVSIDGGPQITILDDPAKIPQWDMKPTLQVDVFSPLGTSGVTPELSGTVSMYVDFFRVEALDS